jgi:hypothetical protein
MTLGAAFQRFHRLLSDRLYRHIDTISRWGTWPKRFDIGGQGMGYVLDFAFGEFFRQEFEYSRDRLGSEENRICFERLIDTSDEIRLWRSFTGVAMRCQCS